MPILPNFETAAKKLENITPVNKLENVSLVSSIQSGAANALGGLGQIGKNLNSGINKFLGIPGAADQGGGGTNDSNNKVVEQANISEVSEDRVQLPDNVKAPFENVLHSYASYNYLWTLSVLTKNQVNFPDDTYKKGDYGQIIFKSASGDPENRVSLSSYKSAANPEGKYDYFIENCRVKGVIGLDKMTGNTNSTGIEFTVVEPYSIGLFFQSLMVAALKANYKNWVEAPFLLTLEFVGHYNYSEQNQKSITKKHFPLKIMDIQMRVTPQGSQYQCIAVPWNERAFSTKFGTIKTEVTVTGRTVQEMLQKGPKSLQSVVNEQLRQAAKNNEIPIADQLLILFPSDPTSANSSPSTEDSSGGDSYTVDPNDSQQVYGDTGVFKKLGVEKASDDYNLVQNSNVNKIGLADMGFIDQRKTEAVFGKDNATWDPDKKVFVRGDIIIKEKEGQATFKQGTSIPNIINQLILSSDYGRQALENIDNDGFIMWWRIDTQLYLLESEANIKKIGRYPVLAVYRILPHPVHHSKFLPPDQKPKGIEAIAEQAVKEYNYIYTSKNFEILDFQINFKAGFYTALAADGGKNNKGVQMRDQNAADSTPVVPATNDGKTTGVKTDSGGKTFDPSTGAGEFGSEPTETMPVISPDLVDLSANQGGANQDDPGTIAARQFHIAVNMMADMVTVQMKILGDPFYMGDSGMGNYTAKSTSNRSVTADNSINYQRGAVYIKLYFFNPVDINHEKGMYDFPNGEVVPQFSGLYQVAQVESVFERGLFTQNLDLLRMPNQTLKGPPPGKPKVATSEQVDNFKPGDGIPDPSIDNDR